MQAGYIRAFVTYQPDTLSSFIAMQSQQCKIRPQKIGTSLPVVLAHLPLNLLEHHQA